MRVRVVSAICLDNAASDDLQSWISQQGRSHASGRSGSPERRRSRHVGGSERLWEIPKRMPTCRRWDRCAMLPACVRACAPDRRGAAGGAARPAPHARKRGAKPAAHAAHGAAINADPSASCQPGRGEWPHPAIQLGDVTREGSTGSPSAGDVGRRPRVRLQLKIRSLSPLARRSSQRAGGPGKAQPSSFGWEGRTL
jgi:hypothetical protein